MKWRWGTELETVEERVLGQELLRKNRCPFCKHDEFFDGPSGAISQNIECANCGARFNLLGLGTMGAEYIGGHRDPPNP